MKKFMKAIAFATVMCLVLSTAAFATYEVTDYEAKKITVTVNGVATGEQVALIITNDGADFTKDNIVFVDQKAAGTSTAVFEASAAGATGTTVDIYAGYATNSGTTAVLVDANVDLTAPVVEIEVTLADAKIVADITEVSREDETITVADGKKGALAYFKINVKNGTEGDITDMYWSFVVKNDETEKTITKHYQGDNTILAALGSVCTGDVELAAALDSTGYTLENASIALKVKGNKVSFSAVE